MAALRTGVRLFFRFSIEGIEHIPAGGAVIVGNHPSALDPLFIGPFLPRRARFVGAAEFTTTPFIGWVIRSYGIIAVHRGQTDPSVIKEATRMLKAGGLVVIFPEGRIVPHGGPLKSGAGVLAAAAHVPTVPVAVHGSGRALPLGKFVPRPAVRVRVVFGPALPPPATASRADGEATLEAAMAWVRQRVPLPSADGAGVANATPTAHHDRRSQVKRLKRLVSVATVVLLAAVGAAAQTVRGDAQAWQEVQAALRRLGVVRTYRARSTFEQGTTLLVEVVNPDRRRIVNQLSNGDTMEIVMVGAETRWRASHPGQPGAWQCSSAPLFPGQTDPTRAQIQGEVTVSRLGEMVIEGTRTQGYEYAVVVSGQTTRQRLYVRTDTGLPRRFELLDAAGKVAMTTDYFDFDAAITIDLPACGQRG